MCLSQEMAMQDCDDLHGALVSSCISAGLQPDEAFITKATQLSETFSVRFGVMLVGPTGESRMPVNSANHHNKKVCIMVSQDIHVTAHPNAPLYITCGYNN